MKLWTALMLLSLLQVKANGYSQKVTLKLQNVSLQKVFKEIHDQTGLNFFYKSQVIKQIGKVSINVKDVDVNAALNQCLAAHPLTFKLVAGIVVISEKASPPPVFTRPDFEVSGTVQTENGSPLAGASVQLKGRASGANTDSAGRFRIQVPDQGGILEISYVGYETAVYPVTAATTLSITLKVSVAIADQVLVIGYGTQRKKEATTAVSQISGREILESQSITVSNALSGKVPGLIINQRNSRPGSDGATFTVRGLSTYRNNSALIVVDGIANRDGLDRIDPNDIESITVLKDASAAIYGAQSANGVILITTKRGKSGRPKVTYAYNHGFVSPVRLMKMSDAANYAKKVNDLALQAGQTLPFTDQEIADYQSGKLASTDWLDEVYKSHFNQHRHSLTLSGGSEAVKYFLSGGTVSQGSLLTNDDISKYRQYNFRSNVDVQVNKRLSIGMDLSGRRQNTNYPYLGENTLYRHGLVGIPTNPATIDGLPARGSENNNPLAIVTSPAYDKTQLNMINGTIRFDYKIPGVTGLWVDGFGAVDYVQSMRDRWQQPHYFYEKDNNGELQRFPNNQNTSFTKNNIQSNSYTLNAKLNYSRTFAEHQVSAFVAVERNETRLDSSEAARTGYISSQVDQLFAGSPSGQTNTGIGFEGARLNYFGRVAYSYDRKYLLQLQFRYDGSQIFPEDKRFGFFPGISAGWVLSEENFMKNISFLSNLKIRASYGLLGNDRIAQFQYLNLYDLSATNGSGYVIDGVNYSVLNPRVAANPNVTWEKKKTLDIGVEGAFLGNRLSFEFDYFRMKTEDILYRRNVSVPNYTGLTLPDENIGIVENNGFDGQIRYNGSVNKDLTFNVGVNFTYAKNQVVFIDEGTIVPAHQKEEGKSVGSMLLYQVIGMYRTDKDTASFPGLNGVKRFGDLIYEDVNGDGKITVEDRARSDYGNAPRLQYGFVFGAQYKGFDLSGNFMGQGRALVQLDYSVAAGSNTPEYYVKNAWSPSNPNGSLPRVGRSLAQSGQANTLNTRNVAFIRLKNIELGYTIPTALLNRVGLQGARVYINGYNLLTFDKLKKDGLQDPEEINPQAWQFPQTKSVNVGINVNL